MCCKNLLAYILLCSAHPVATAGAVLVPSPSPWESLLSPTNELPRANLRHLQSFGKYWYHQPLQGMVASTLWLQASLYGNQTTPHDARLLGTYPRFSVCLEVTIICNVCCSITYECRLCRRPEKFLRGCTGHVGSLQVVVMHAPH